MGEKIFSIHALKLADFDSKISEIAFPYIYSFMNKNHMSKLKHEKAEANAGTLTTKDPRNLKPSSVFKKIC